MFNRLLKAAFLGLLALVSVCGWGQVYSFANGPQHQSNYNVAAQHLNQVKWFASINDNVTGGYAHYGAPLITDGNTIIVMVRTATDGYDLLALDGNTGLQKYRIPTGYTQPSGVTWLVPVQPAITTGSFGTRLYYPGPGGTIYRLDNPDSSTPGTPTRIAFFGNSNYAGNQSGFNTALNVNTPIVTDNNGNVYFGIRTSGTAPAPLSTTNGFVVRVDSSDTATYAATNSITGDSNITRVTHGSAFALSQDGTKLYVAMKGNSSVTSPNLVMLNSTTLAMVSKVALKDPRNGSDASVSDLSTSSPMVAPDGDVYFGILSNPYNGSRGFLLRFSGDLGTEKTPGAFGWDYTPAIIPASMVPSYTGTSSYLLFCKYNNYFTGDGNGVNTVAILDPNDTQIDFHPSANNLVEMRTVFTMIAPTPDEEFQTQIPAAREWCINASAVSVPNKSVYFNSEDGHLYKWDLTKNQLAEAVQLNAGVGQPYVPTIIGADGTLYTLNGGYMFAVGGYDDVEVTLTSSVPDMRDAVTGQSVTFTATVSPLVDAVPTGTVLFEDTTIENYVPVTRTLGTGTLNADGIATITVPLNGGAVVSGNHWGNHRISATYSGDTNLGGGYAELRQKIHAFGTSVTASTGVGTFTFGSPVAFTGSVVPTGTSSIPTGYMTFSEGSATLAQIPLDSSGLAGASRSFLPGSHTLKAYYNSDTFFAASSGTTSFTVVAATSSALSLSSSSSNYSDPVTLTVGVSGPSGAGIPLGTVQFFDGGVLIGTSPVDGTGVASLTVSNLGVGDHNLTATFNGQTGWLTSSAASQTLRVNSGTVTVGTAAPSPTVENTATTLTATVSASISGAGVPSGSVEFYEGTTLLGTGTVNNSGVASLVISSITPGSHTYVAKFIGNAGWGNSNSIGFQVFAKTQTQSVLTSSRNPAVIGQSVTLSVTITGTGGTPTGSVVFVDNGTTLGTATVNGSGVATLVTSSLALGSHTIVASFTGTGSWTDSSATLTQTISQDVTAPPAPVGVTAFTGSGFGTIRLGWSASVDPDGSAVQYLIYAADRSSGPFQLIARTASRTYIDRFGRRKRRWYYIKAVDAYGNTSPASATVNAVSR